MSESDSSEENNIEKIEDKYILNNTVNYIVKYKNMKTFMSVTFDQLNKKEQKFIRKYEKLLNQKREKELNNYSKYDSIIPQIKEKKYKKDGKSILPQNKKKKYKNEKESIISQVKKMKYKNDEESENSQSLSHHKIENKFNKKYKDNNNKESKKIYQKQNSFDYNFGNNNDFSMSSKFERDGILLDDSPLKILNVGTKNMNDKNLFCLVRWKQTNKDIRILDSIIDIEKIKKAYPDLLIDFYESKIIFSQYLDD